jgi:D-3-phosphoglycerate dehydrogenase
MFDRTASGKWGEGQTVVNEIRNRTIGVVGVGTIGSQVAEIAASSFGADVVAYDPYVTGEKVSEIYPRVTQDEMEKKGVAFLAKDELFEASSLVTMHVPLTDDTYAMVGKKELEALNGGYFINLSRGGVVDEDALHHAVKNNIIEAAALDVMSSEPPQPSNPLLRLDDVYVTPHIAGGKEGYKKRSAKINSLRISNFLSGGKIKNVVNPSVI